MINYSFFESIMGKRKQKRKSTREPQLSANSRAASKRAEQDVVHRVVITSLERSHKLVKVQLRSDSGHRLNGALSLNKSSRFNRNFDQF